MAQSIRIYRVEQFPEVFPIETEEITLESNTQARFKTTVRHLGTSEYTEEDLQKYQVNHPIGSNFQGQGYLEDGSFCDIYAISTDERFTFFKNENNFIFTSGTKRAISEHALKRLNTYTTGSNTLRTTTIELDLIALKNKLMEGALAQIKGGWWRDMDIADVEVAYLGGGTVTLSSDWSRYEENGGTISALRIDIPNALEPVKILLTKDGNCVVYKKIEEEEELLNLIIPIFNLAKEFIIN